MRTLERCAPLSIGLRFGLFARTKSCGGEEEPVVVPRMTDDVVRDKSARKVDWRH